MSEIEEYNGWANRETWAASLHLNNDEGLYLLVDGWARDWAGSEDHPDADPSDTRRYITNRLADMIEELVDELFSGELGMNDDIEMMRSEVGSLWRVDWFAVADGFLSEHMPASV